MKISRTLARSRQAGTGTQQYLPGGFFLAPDDLGYGGSALYLTTTYRW